MLSLNNKISSRQLQMLIVIDIFGTGVTALPRIVAEHAEQDAWISIILASLSAILFTYFICSIAEKFPTKNFVDYSSQILTRPIGILLSLLFAIKIIITLALQVRLFGEIIKETMLYNTPFSIICISMLLLGAYAASKGYEARARMAEILVIVAFIPLIIIFIIAAFDVDFTNMLPTMTTAPEGLLKGGIKALFAFSGVEFVLLAYPYLQRPKEAKLNAITSISAIGILMLFITIITISRFGAEDVKHQMWPVIEMMDSVNLPGAFIERQDALIMSFWIISVFAFINAGMFFSSLLIKDVFKKGKHPTYILILIPIVFVLSFVPNNMLETYKYMDFANTIFGTIFIIAVPILLLIIAKLRRL